MTTQDQDSDWSSSDSRFIHSSLFSPGVRGRNHLYHNLTPKGIIVDMVFVFLVHTPILKGPYPLWSSSISSYVLQGYPKYSIPDGCNFSVLYVIVVVISD